MDSMADLRIEDQLNLKYTRVQGWPRSVPCASLLLNDRMIRHDLIVPL